MNTDMEKMDIKEMIQSLYRFANILPVWDGEVNDDVAAVFGTMIAEVRRGSSQPRLSLFLPTGIRRSSS
jgi:hypothetical protein